MFIRYNPKHFVFSVITSQLGARRNQRIVYQSRKGPLQAQTTASNGKGKT